jgi:hypothetical protein
MLAMRAIANLVGTRNGKQLLGSDRIGEVRCGEFTTLESADLFRCWFTVVIGSSESPSLRRLQQEHPRSFGDHRLEVRSLISPDEVFDTDFVITVAPYLLLTARTRFRKVEHCYSS